MSNNVKLEAKKRDESLNPRQVRESGLVTGTIYGKKSNPISIQFDAKDFGMKYKINPNATYKISLGKEVYDAEVTNVQKDYRTNKDLNVEFKIV